MNWDKLSRLRLFEGVDLQPVKELLQLCPVRELRPGEILISAGEPNDRLYLLVSGRLRVHLDSIDSEPVAVIKPGESVGELSVIDQRPTSAFVVSDQFSQLLVISDEIFWAMVDTPPRSIARNLLVALSERLRTSNITISKGKRLEQEYKRQATTDSLTGLPNRRWLEDVLGREMISRAKDRRPLSLIVGEVDQFKDYEAELGPEAADHALYAVSQTLINNLRSANHLVRYGTAKFAVVLPDVSVSQAKLVAERLREAVAEAVIVMSDQSVLPSVTISIGVVQMQLDQSAEALIGNASAALIRAKARGTNCVAV